MVFFDLRNSRGSLNQITFAPSLGSGLRLVIATRGIRVSVVVEPSGWDADTRILQAGGPGIPSQPRGNCSSRIRTVSAEVKSAWSCGRGLARGGTPAV